MLFFLTVDIIIPLIIASVGSACLSTTASSAFRTIFFTEFLVTHDDMFARWCKKWNRCNLDRIFFHYLVQVKARTQLWTVFRSLNASFEFLSNRVSCVRCTVRQMENSPRVVQKLGSQTFTYEFSLTKGRICDFKSFLIVCRRRMSPGRGIFLLQMNHITNRALLKIVVFFMNYNYWFCCYKNFVQIETSFFTLIIIHYIIITL
jgi:hypothetical protein